MEESVFIDRVRDIFAVLDRCVYGLITIFYDTIENLTEVTVISSGEISAIAGRIYTLLALFMIFKVSFSLINYLVNPDLINDKAKGGTALIKNIVITIALIIMVPFGFNLLYEAQSAILNDNLIGTALFGSDSDESSYSFKISEQCTTQATTSSAGDYMGLMAFRPFFQPSDVRDTSDWNDNVDNVHSMYCAGDSTGGGKASVSNLLKNNEVYSAPHGFSFEKNYTIDYTFFISTIVGIVIALIMLGFCFDVAVRTIKLQFYELIAPIPIISFIDPDSSKNGMFKKWYKEVLSTWASLFMRLLAINFAIYGIGLLSNTTIPGDSLWIKLLLIIGLLIFAKQLPKIIEDLLGIKMSGKFTLNPLKKLDNEALGFKEARVLAGKAAVGTGALGLSVAGSVIGHNRAKKKFADDNNKLDSGFQKKLREMRNKKTNGEITAAQWREQMLNEKANYKEKKDKLNDDYNKFSNNHPIASGLAAAGRSAAAGFSKGAKSFTEALQNATVAATQSAKLRNAHDNLNMSARIDDLITDIAGVKNASGTTSEIKKQIKDVTEGLNDITNNISSLNYALGDIQRTASGSIAYDSNGQMKVNDSYAWTDPNQKAQLQYTIDSYNELRSLQKTRQKELNTLNDILAKPNAK